MSRNLKKNERELFRALSDVTKELLENIILCHLQQDCSPHPVTEK
jgi:hypothetical protein